MLVPKEIQEKLKADLIKKGMPSDKIVTTSDQEKFELKSKTEEKKIDLIRCENLNDELYNRIEKMKIEMSSLKQQVINEQNKREAILNVSGLILLSALLLGILLWFVRNRRNKKPSI